MTQEKFLAGIDEATNHRPLLWLALELTEGSRKPVGEFGAGTGSTPYLREYCKEKQRSFISYDSNESWANKWQSKHETDWLNPLLYFPYSVVLIDQAPGEYRRKSIEFLQDNTDIIVVHDAEPNYANGYLLETIWHLFKYRIFTKGETIWTAALSNKIPLTDNVNTTVANFKIEI